MLQHGCRGVLDPTFHQQRTFLHNREETVERYVRVMQGYTRVESVRGYVEAQVSGPSVPVLPNLLGQRPRYKGECHGINVPVNVVHIIKRLQCILQQRLVIRLGSSQ